MNQIPEQLNRDDLMQILGNRRPTIPEDWNPRRTGVAGYDMIGVIIFTAGIVFGLGMMVQSCTREPMPTVTKAAQVGCNECHAQSRHSKMTEYFKKAKHPEDPAKLATAVLQTSYPRTLAAIAVVENSPVTSRKGGFRSRHRGSWQMSKHNEKAYGRTPHDLNGQAAQAARLLRDLLEEEKSLPMAISKYGGEISTDRYQRRVLAALQEAP